MEKTIKKPTTECAAGLDAMWEIRECIREAGRMQSGDLYARLMTRGCRPEMYEHIIGLMKSIGAIKEEGHELVWIKWPV